jgi:putative SOS response-associated peptidase YedK
MQTLRVSDNPQGLRSCVTLEVPMCGRFTIFTDPERLAERFQASVPGAGLQPRYNAAPTQLLPVILNDGPRAIQLLQWGLIPFWAKDPSIGSRMINARAETLSEKPAFRAAFKKRRCLVLANGFYEWRKTPGGKQPMHITLASGEPFAFAGLWETWDAPDGSLLRTFTIVTGEPNELVASIHNRMPAILLPEHEAIWLDNAAEPGIWQDILRPYPAERMAAYPVSRRVNYVGNDDAGLVEREA